MKSRPLLATAVLLSTVCGDTPAVELKSVPELPAELADQLTRVGESTWLGNGRVRSTAKPDPTPHERRECWASYYYTAQVTYPRTYCVVPPELGTLLSDRETETLDASGASSDGSLQVSRLVHAGTDGSEQLLTCVTRSGPWLAEITQQDRCDGTTSHFLAPFNAFMPQVPGAGSVFPPIEWDGTVGGLPPNYGWASDRVPWTVWMRGGRCTATQMTMCPGERAGDVPGQEPDPPIIF